MKNTVDLTIKRDFNKNNDQFFTVIQRTLNLQLTGYKHSFPWRPSIRRIQNEADLTVQAGGLYKESDYYNENVIIVGTKKNREDFKFYRKLNLNICERCGKDLNEVPWKRECIFCSKCSEDLKTENERKLEKVPWKKFTNTQENRICWKGGVRLNES